MKYMVVQFRTVSIIFQTFTVLVKLKSMRSSKMMKNELSYSVDE